ncbi:hypothetical protein CLOM_g21201 [Closterium sp. NIES-68]|nr:hypothetical protein CLOM_g21201 [Closterium sp. NIES-68]
MPCIISCAVHHLVCRASSRVPCNHRNLRDNQLTGSIPAAVGNLKNLTSLWLSGNRLTGPIPPSIGSLTNLTRLELYQNELEGSIPESIFGLESLIWLDLSANRHTGTISSSISKLTKLFSLSFANNQLYGSIPATITDLKQPFFLDLSHNSLTGPLMYLAGFSDLSSNYLTGLLSSPECERHTLFANCLTPHEECSFQVQRPAAACAAFCGVSNTSAACGGSGMCYPDGPGLVPTCLSCAPGFVQLGGNGCVGEGLVRSFSMSGPILPPYTVLTKGTQRETAGRFMAKPVALFAYPGPGGLSSGCGTELPFKVNFTFSLIPQYGTAGSNGFAFVISAEAKVGSPDGVGYGGMGARSIAIEFGTRGDEKHGDESSQHVGLNIKGVEESVVAQVPPFTLTDTNAYTAWVDYEPGSPGTIRVFLNDSKTKPEEPLLQGELALCEVLLAGGQQRAGGKEETGGKQQQAFFFGFVASTTEEPFQLHGIIDSSVHTGIPSRKPGRIKGQARGLALSVTTYAPPRASPLSRYVSADFVAAASRQDSWRIRAFHSWASLDFLAWPVKNQNDCNASWAYTVVASVEAAYGIAGNQSAPQLSVESLFAAMGLIGTNKSTAGGSPTDAFEKLVTLEGSSGLTGDSDPATRYPVQAFERTLFKGYVGLMLAVQRQPVVAHIEASAATFAMYDGTFKYRDPQCYTGNLNHVVLVVGYFITSDDSSPNHIAPPFWIIRNSWGEEWGDSGHMRMDIQGGDGVCGINVLPGIYPIVKIPEDPCAQGSYRGDEDAKPSMNPCGGFACKATTGSSNTCNCSISGVATQPFVEIANGNGSNTCAYVDACGSYLKNPCYVGTCINDGRGAYSCICPPNYIASRDVFNFPTCDPANATATSMTVSGDNWWCSDVYLLVGLTMDQFTLQNAAMDCSHPLPKGSALQLGGTPATPCTAFFYALNEATCASMNVNVNEGSLASLNPGLNCSQPIKAGRSLCLERNAAFAYTVPQCQQYGMLTPQDTCIRLMLKAIKDQWNPLVELYRINPGLICSLTIPSSASVVGSKIGVQICLRADYWSIKSRVCKKGRVKPISPSLACSAAYRFYSGDTSTATSKFLYYNGMPCSGTVGSKFICVP